MNDIEINNNFIRLIDKVSALSSEASIGWYNKTKLNKITNKSYSDFKDGKTSNINKKYLPKIIRLIHTANGNVSSIKMDIINLIIKISELLSNTN